MLDQRTLIIKIMLYTEAPLGIVLLHATLYVSSRFQIFYNLNTTLKSIIQVIHWSDVHDTSD